MEAIPSGAFAVFDEQDSGCLSYGVEADGRRIFVKSATTAEAQRSLGRAIQLHRAVRHPAIVAPIEVIDLPERRALVYPWHDGTVLNHATVHGSDRSGLDRFRRLDRQQRLCALDAVFDAHLAVAAAGFVSVDLYDGCFLYDFAREVMHLIDLDEYRPGPFTVEGERLPGSTRYMAPEEHLSGARIDERTTVFHLGRTATELIGPADLTVAQRQVVEVTTSPGPDDRYPRVAALVSAWRSATGSGAGS